MTPAGLAEAASKALAANVSMVLEVRKGGMPRGFPRGELMCENESGFRVYRFALAG